MDNSGLFDVIFTIVGLLLVLIIFVIAQRTYVAPMEPAQTNTFTRPLLNGLKYAQSGIESVYTHVDLTKATQFIEPLFDRLYGLKQHAYIGFQGFYSSAKSENTFVNGLEHIQNTVEGLYLYAAG